MQQTPEQILFRANLWRKFVTEYQKVMITAPESFADYCAKFREQWVKGAE